MKRPKAIHLPHDYQTRLSIYHPASISVAVVASKTAPPGIFADWRGSYVGCHRI